MHKLILMAALLIALCAVPSVSAVAEPIKFQRIPTQFIAALGNPDANAGVGAETWGLWDRDPGPRGVWLRLFPILKASGGYAPGGWKFDSEDWWLDENGLLMEKPAFPVAPGTYLVTSEREVTTWLNIYPKDENGVQRWELGDNASLHDVTHMPCRSARYTPLDKGTECSPSNADKSEFKVPPGSIMPAVHGCKKQDYAVLIVIGKAVRTE